MSFSLRHSLKNSKPDLQGVFCSEEWRECFDVFKNKKWVWIGDEKKGFWAIESKKLFFKIYEAGWRGTYLCGNNIEGREADEFLECFPSFTLKIVINDYYGLLKEGKKFIKKFEKTYILRKKDEEELLRRYRKSLREDINRAKRRGLIFRELGGNYILKFYELYEYTVRKRYKGKLISYSFIEKLYKELKPSGLLDIYGVFEGENLLSTVLVIRVDKDTSLAFLQGTGPEGYKLDASPFLFHNVILKEFSKGYKIFSFGSLPFNSKSLIFFKKNFGAEEYEYPVYIWRNPWYAEE